MKRLENHREAVQEVIDFVSQRRVLSSPFQADSFADFPTLVIHSLDQLERYRDPYAIHARIGADITWDGILEMDSTELYNIENKTNPDFVEDLIPLLAPHLDNIRKILMDQFRYRIPKREILRIAGAFESVILCRAANGESDFVTEKMYRAFRAYGYPCGWCGNFDATGSLVIYSV